jgi:uncharacterized protein YsxB (DUF464 family)
MSVANDTTIIVVERGDFRILDKDDSKIQTGNTPFTVVIHKDGNVKVDYCNQSEPYKDHLKLELTGTTETGDLIRLKDDDFTICSWAISASPCETNVSKQEYNDSYNYKKYIYKLVNCFLGKGKHEKSLVNNRKESKSSLEIIHERATLHLDMTKIENSYYPHLCEDPADFEYISNATTSLTITSEIGIDTKRADSYADILCTAVSFITRNKVKWIERQTLDPDDSILNSCYHCIQPNLMYQRSNNEIFQENQIDSAEKLFKRLSNLDHRQLEILKDIFSLLIYAQREIENHIRFILLYTILESLHANFHGDTKYISKLEKLLRSDDSDETQESIKQSKEDLKKELIKCIKEKIKSECDSQKIDDICKSALSRLYDIPLIERIASWIGKYGFIICEEKLRDMRKLRNDIVHDGYVKAKETHGEFKIQELAEVLHDLISILILKILGISIDDTVEPWQFELKKLINRNILQVPQDNI